MYFPFLWNSARVETDIEEVAERSGQDISTSAHCLMTKGLIMSHPTALVGTSLTKTSNNSWCL